VTEPEFVKLAAAGYGRIAVLAEARADLKNFVEGRRMS
jgi:hypothetical protein